MDFECNQLNIEQLCNSQIFRIFALYITIVNYTLNEDIFLHEFHKYGHIDTVEQEYDIGFD